MSDRGRAVVDRLRHMAEAADAILYQIVVLGEAAKAALVADPELAVAHPDIDWSPVARMRDRVAHYYWATDSEIVWTTARHAVPALRRAVGVAIASA